MNTTVVLGVLCAVLAVCAIVLACVFAKRKKRIRTITRSIDKYQGAVQAEYGIYFRCFPPVKNTACRSAPVL